MLKSLTVKDFALIEDVEINFDSGLTVLTGETGAGKSIILESLSLIFAKRSDQEMIRHGKDKALVSANFVLDSNLQAFFDLEENINITREIDKSGRHKITLNEKIITLTYLRQLTNKIGSIHSQNDLYQLLDQSLYLSFVDQINEKLINDHLSKYLIKRSNYLEAVKHLNGLKQKEKLELEQKDFLEYQLKELTSYNLTKGEKEELETNVKMLSNFDRIASNLATIINNFDNINIDSLYENSKLLDQIKSYDIDYEKANEDLLNIYYELTEIKSKLDSKQYELDFDQNEFDLMQERLYTIEKLEKKYQKDINDLIDYTEELEEKLSLINNYDSYILKYEEKVKSLYNDVLESGLKLRDVRKKLAKTFEKEVINELKDLDLENTKFEVSFDDEDLTFKDDGIDTIDFLISLNIGEPIKPLAKVASGGERARFMFAIKTIFAKQNDLKLLVLDEIDIGISGKTAAKMANKMQVLSETIQLIVITHLPQVAAKADTHFGITKQFINNRMQTLINELTNDQRIENIALMLSDESLSSFAIEQAKQLLKK